MNRKFFIFLSILSLLLGAEYIYLKTHKSLKPKDIILKRDIVKLSTLTDLAVSTETRAVRFRSVADFFSVFNEDPELLEYFPTTFVYAPCDNLRKNPSRIEIE